MSDIQNENVGDGHLNDPAVQKEIRNALTEISNSLTRVEAERDLIKDIVNRVYDDHAVPKKVFRKMARTYHKQNFSEEVAVNDEFETLYETITNTSSKL